MGGTAEDGRETVLSTLWKSAKKVGGTANRTYKPYRTYAAVAYAAYAAYVAYAAVSYAA